MVTKLFEKWSQKIFLPAAILESEKTLGPRLCFPFRGVMHAGSQGADWVVKHDGAIPPAGPPPAVYQNLRLLLIVTISPCILLDPVSYSEVLK